MRVCLTVALSVAATEPLRIKGVLPAVFTPFSDDGQSLNTEVIPKFAQYLNATGVEYVFVAGTTGESLSLTMTERMALTEAWAKQGMKVITHVGAESLLDAKALAAHAQDNGAVALGCMPPVFFKPANVSMLAKWLQEVGAAAPKLPLYYYHIPSMTGVEFMMLDLIKEVEKLGVPTFAGVKYTGLYEPRSFMDFEQCSEYAGGKYEILCGREEMSAQALAVGAQGFIGSQFNFAADLYEELARRFPTQDYLAVQDRALALLNAWGGGSVGVNGNKQVMEFVGLGMGGARLPSVDASKADVAAQQQRLRAWCTETKKAIHFEPHMCQQSSVVV
mmetsp:Transcript_57645/g.154017  ORF Transcript_57645/g.154017 Transcript_57645/m.154017 type:complete len:333 (-) Transcript_57645:321-1319(-)